MNGKTKTLTKVKRSVRRNRKDMMVLNGVRSRKL